MRNLQGAGLIIAVDGIEKRLELAKDYGADVTINFEEKNPVDTIMELTDGKGVDSAIESLGAQKTFEDCVKVTSPGGTISNIGYHGEGDYVNIPRMEWGVGMSNKTIKTELCPGGKVRMSRLLRLLEQKKVDPTPMTTHTFKFDEIEKAFEMMEKKKTAS
ncbi:MAG: zinc-binding dehydrogenase [Melioribacteraceae bacterium]|nr:zinc-binding dehydrogenase [Melioribacteraceae bacterium]